MDTVQNSSPAKVSVIIPVYNVEQFLCECINSVLSQTYQNFEILLIDDGATDTSGKICDRYAEQDTRIKVIHRENGGLSVARNTGLAAAVGEYIYFLDSDDYIEPDSLALLIETAKREQADVVFFDAEVFFTDCEANPNTYRYERTKQYSTMNGRQLLLSLLDTDEYRTAVPLMLFRHDYLTEHRLQFQEGILHEDELFTFCVYYADGKIAHCHEKLYYRRMRAASIMTGSSSRRRYDSMTTIYFILSGMYLKHEIAGLSAQRYLARIARSVITKYKELDAGNQAECHDRQNSFKKDVLRNRGYNDLKLKMKCSEGMRRMLYRVQNKLRSR